MYIYLHDPESGYWIEVIEAATDDDWFYSFKVRRQPGSMEPAAELFHTQRPRSQTLDEIKDIWLEYIEVRLRSMSNKHFEEGTLNCLEEYSEIDVEEVKIAAYEEFVPEPELMDVSRNTFTYSMRTGPN